MVKVLLFSSTVNTSLETISQGVVSLVSGKPYLGVSYGSSGDAYKILELFTDSQTTFNITMSDEPDGIPNTITISLTKKGNVHYNILTDDGLLELDIDPSYFASIYGLSYVDNDIVFNTSTPETSYEYRLDYTDTEIVAGVSFFDFDVPANRYFLYRSVQYSGSGFELIALDDKTVTNYAFQMLPYDTVNFGTQSLVDVTLDLEKIVNLGHGMVYFHATDLNSVSFDISSKASKKLFDDFVAFNNIASTGGGSTDTDNSSLNGRYGSLKDGTHVTVIGRDNMEFVVVSSDFIYQDSTSGYYMLNYTLKKVDDNAHIVVPDKLLKPIVTP